MPSFRMSKAPEKRHCLWRPAPLSSSGHRFFWRVSAVLVGGWVWLRCGKSEQSHLKSGRLWCSATLGLSGRFTSIQGQRRHDRPYRFVCRKRSVLEVCKRGQRSRSRFPALLLLCSPHAPSDPDDAHAEKRCKEPGSTLSSTWPPRLHLHLQSGWFRVEFIGQTLQPYYREFQARHGLCSALAASSNAVVAAMSPRAHPQAQAQAQAHPSRVHPHQKPNTHTPHSCLHAPLAWTARNSDPLPSTVVNGQPCPSISTSLRLFELPRSHCRPGNRHLQCLQCPQCPHRPADHVVSTSFRLDAPRIASNLYLIRVQPPITCNYGRASYMGNSPSTLVSYAWNSCPMIHLPLL